MRRIVFGLFAVFAVPLTLPLSPCLPAGRHWGEGGDEGKIPNIFV